jgi:hypothetical protein
MDFLEMISLTYSYSLDQDQAQARDGADFNPDVQERDYEQLAEMLPVFCVSSRAYQKLSGNMKKDEAISGFPTLEDTESPPCKPMH